MTKKNATKPKAPAASWEERLKQLAAFKARHGHCDVPKKYPSNQLLANWVTNLRYSKKQGMLSEEKVRCLDSPGFRWQIKKRSVARLDWDEMIRRLLKFRQKRGLRL